MMPITIGLFLHSEMFNVFYNDFIVFRVYYIYFLCEIPKETINQVFGQSSSNE